MMLIDVAKKMNAGLPEFIKRCIVFIIKHIFFEKLPEPFD